MKVFRNALQSISQNKLRSVLAGFGIAWGIFLLVIFLGIGSGLKDGVMSLLNVYAQKSLFFYGGQTSVSTERINKNAIIVFDKDVVSNILRRYPFIKACSPEMSMSGMAVKRMEGKTTTTISGVDADYFKIKLLNIKEGRALSYLDIKAGNNVAVIGEGIRQSLFGKTSAINKFIDINGCLFKVIGVLTSDDLLSIQERNSVYIPSSSYESNFNSLGRLSAFCLSLPSSVKASDIEKDIKGYLSYKYGFDPNDEDALYVANIEAQTSSFEQLFKGLEVLIWLIGLCLLLSGIVGVCNVMLIIVKERTSEIGIRKAVGAKSGSIITMILTESILITILSGFIGALLGGCLVIIGNKIVIPHLEIDIIQSMGLNFPAIIMAIIVISISGVLAGLFPALKASKISPVDAIRYDYRD